MPLRIQLFRKITIIGVGLIGGSIARAVKKHRLAREVIGFSQRHSTLTTALKAKIIDQGYHDVKKAVANADLVILATPVSIITGMLSIIGPHLKRNCIITDVGSTKVSIVNAADEHLPNPSLFVGSHPLAGSEKKGVQYSDSELFKDTLCIMTPKKGTNRGAREKVKRLWSKIGARVKMLSPEEHDRILGYISHFPHIWAYALMETIPSDCLDYAASGLKDTTRIASSTPQVWNDICLGNAKNIVAAIDEIVGNLATLRSAIKSGDSKSLIEHFDIAKKKRDKIN